MVGSLLTIGSCSWVRLRGPEEANRNLGIWNRSSRSTDTSVFFSYCAPYSSDFKPDGYLKMARASTILAPLMGLLSIVCSMQGSICASSLGATVGVASALLAAIFQGLTLTVNNSRACAEFSDRAFCVVGFFTWAFWVSLVATLLYAIGFGFSIVNYASAQTQAQEEERKDAAAAPAAPVDPEEQ